MNRLNYHHLYYFWQVAKIGNLTKTAEQLHVSQSALSAQIKQLEQNLGISLFNRTGRQLTLTESGHQTLRYAEDIFSKGAELEQLLASGIDPEHVTIRIGTLATMSRNFIEALIAPLLSQGDCRFIFKSMDQAKLLNALADHQLDFALTNIAVLGSNKQLWQSQLLAHQPVVIVGPPNLALSGDLNAQYQRQNWVLPTIESPLRTSFDALCAHYQLKTNVVAEADDMAMLRLLARDSGALAVLPKVVVEDELKSGVLQQYLELPNSYENCYALTVPRQRIHPKLASLLAMLGAQATATL